jgi:hypothetical protein
MVHPDTTLKFVNPVMGSGVFATEFIPKGTLTYVKDSLEIDISPSHYSRHPKPMQGVIDKYSYIDEQGHYIISWDNAKYINHNCEPNTISTGYGFEMAIKDIYPDDQITDEYGIFNLETSFKCECGAPHCRGTIKPEDLDLLYAEWDEKIIPALSQFHRVRQPLAPFLTKEVSQQLDQFLSDPRQYRGIHSLRYLKEKVMAR